MEAGTRKFAAIVVVILLVLGGLVGALFLTLTTDDDDDQYDGWSVEDDYWYTVDGDARWTGWDIRLDGAITVEEGGNLLLEDCRIEVPLERLVFDSQTTIDVHEGASLELRDSELSLSAAPELDKAWICYDVYYDESVPNMWRVVNLRGATSPILEFDVELWSEDCRIAVAVQVAPDAELEILGAFGTDEVGWMEWSHVEVHLDGFIGATPRVVVFVDSYGDAFVGEVLLLSNLRINDGDGPLPGDPFMTGDPMEDGWSIEYFESFMDALIDSHGSVITSLLASDGDLRIIGSRIGSPSGISRISDGYVPHRSSDGFFTWSTLWIDTWIADILIFLGSLTILDSEISFVPIHGQECTVEIDNTTFVGANDMLTLVGSRGSVSRSSFTSDRGIEFESLGPSEDIMWQVAIEDVFSPVGFAIEDCIFSGYGNEEGDGYGLHLNNANIRPIGCTFDDLEVGIWNHESDLGLDWDAVAGSNSFGDNCAYWYIDTRVTRLEFEWSGMPDRSYRDGYWDFISYEEDLQVPFDVYLYRTNTFAFIFAPVLLTGPNLGVVPLDNVTIWIDPNWANERHVSFDPHDEVATFWFGKEEEDPYFDMYALYRLEHDRGYSAGRVHQEASIYMDGISFQDPMVDLYRDGAFMGRLDVKISTMPYYEAYTFVNVSHDMAIPAGFHQITLSLTALLVATQSRVLAGTFNMTFFRIDEARDDLDTTGLASVNEATILIDPYVEQEGVDLTFASTDRSYYDFDIITWIGSRLVLETIDVPDNAPFYLYSIGPGEVVIGDVKASYVAFTTANTSIVFQGTMEGYIDLWIESSDVVVNGQIRGGPFSVVLLWGSNLTMEGSLVDTTRGLTIDVEESNATISDCTFTTLEGSTPVYLMAYGNSSIVISDCTFLGTSMYVSPRDINCALEVVDCTFKDQDSYLLLMNYSQPGYWDDHYSTPITPGEGEISGNVFEGEGTGLVFHLDSRDGFLGPNSFNDGAKALALLAFQISFEDQTYGCYTYVIDATETEDQGHEALDLSDEDFWRDWFRFLVDVTDDPMNGGIPDAVPVVIRITNRWSNWNGVVVMFGRIPLDGQPFTFDIPMWDDIESDLILLIPNLDDLGNWWTDP